MLLAQAMKGEIIKYNSLIKAIKPRPELRTAHRMVLKLPKN